MNADAFFSAVETRMVESSPALSLAYATHVRPLSIEEAQAAVAAFRGSTPTRGASNGNRYKTPDPCIVGEPGRCAICGGIAYSPRAVLCLTHSRERKLAQARAAARRREARQSCG